MVSSGNAYRCSELGYTLLVGPGFGTPVNIKSTTGLSHDAPSRSTSVGRGQGGGGGGQGGLELPDEHMNQL